MGNGTGRGDYPRASIDQSFDDGSADALGCAGDQSAMTFKLKIEIHGMISRAAILSPSMEKKYRRSVGLPGKSPAR